MRAFHIYHTLDLKKINTSYPEEEFEDTKGAIIICKSKNRQHNGQKKKDKWTNNDQQNIHIKLNIECHEPH